MRSTLVLVVVLALAALLVIGCSKGGNDYQTGYASYGQPAQGGAQQGYVGGGCAVSGPEPSNVEISDPIAAA